MARAERMDDTPDSGGPPDPTLEREYGTIGPFAVVIPVHNEGMTIRDVAQRALRHASQVFVVDDGSTDDTAQALHGLQVVLLRNPSNLGKAASLWRGFHAAMDAGARAIVTLDGDGQHLPEDIPRLVSMAREFPGFLIIGARKRRWSRRTFWRLFANCVADFWVSWAAGYPIADSQSGYRVYPSRLLQETQAKHAKAQGFVFESEVLIEGARAGFYSIPVSIDSPPRDTALSSHFRPVLDVLRLTRMVAWKLLSRGMYPMGLYRSLFSRSKGLTESNRENTPPSLLQINSDARISTKKELPH